MCAKGVTEGGASRDLATSDPAVEMPVRTTRVRLDPLILVPPHREGVTDVAPSLRSLRTLGLLLILLVGPAPTSYALSYASSYEPSPGESRAGSRAGEGRERPGRSATPAEETQEETQEEEGREEPRENDAAAAHPDGPAGRERSEAAVAPEPPRNTAPRSDPSTEAEHAVSRSVRSSQPVLRVLPLGSGLVLIGLGLGLAFLALRVRRG